MDEYVNIIIPPNNNLAKALGEEIVCLECSYKLSGTQNTNYCSAGCQEKAYRKWIKEQKKK